MSMELLQRIKRMEERIAKLEEMANNQPIEPETIAPSRDAKEVKHGKRPYNRKPK